MHLGNFRVQHIFINLAISLDFCAKNPYLAIFKYFFKQHVPLLCIVTVENNTNKKSIKVQGDMLNFCDFVQVYCIYHKSPL